jgi:hypothetical protein
MTEPTLEPGSLEEARRALFLDTAQASPRSDLLVAWLVDDEPPLLGRFANLIVLTRQKGRLVRATATDTPRPATLVNLVWIAYGELAQTPDGALVIRSLGLAPAFGPSATGQLEPPIVRPVPGGSGLELEPLEVRPEPVLGVTAAMLRLLSPEKIVNEAVQYLRASQYRLQLGDRLGATTIDVRQTAAYKRLEQAKPRSRKRPSEDEIAAIAKRYLWLVRHGSRRPLPQLALEFGLSREQARDRVHRARDLGFLTKGSPGRAGADVGPKLLEPGTNPSKTSSTTKKKPKRGGTTNG